MVAIILAPYTKEVKELNKTTKKLLNYIKKLAMVEIYMVAIILESYIIMVKASNKTTKNLLNYLKNLVMAEI